MRVAQSVERYELTGQALRVLVERRTMEAPRSGHAAMIMAKNRFARRAGHAA